MVAELEEFQLGDRCLVQSSKRIFAREYVENGIPFFRSKDVIDKSLGVFTNYDLYISEERYQEIKQKHGSPQKGDLLISSVGNRSGQPYIVQDEGDFYFKDGNILWLSQFNYIDPDYLAYWLKSSLGKSTLDSIMIGSAQKALTIDAMKKLWVSFPEYESQKAIAHILGTLDDKIELNRQMNATLEAMAQALFKSWFVDFDPVIDNALAAGNPIPEPLQTRAEARKALGDQRKPLPIANGSLSATLPEGIQNQFPNHFVFNEDMGWVPEGWLISTADEEFVLAGGGTPSTKNSEFWEGGNIPWTTPKDLSKAESKILYSTDRQITDEGLAKISSGLLPENTLLLSSRAPVGYLALTVFPVAINQGYIALTPKKHLSNEYTMYWLDSIMDEIKSISGGTTFAEISKKTFRQIKTPVPSGSIVSLFTQHTKSGVNSINANLNEIESLEKIRDSLLPKLLSGEVRVGEFNES